MYRVLLFSGGAYKFNELVEFVEDIGGVLFHGERLQISRGAYFLREEIRVMMAVPGDELENLKAMVKELKGRLQDLELEKELMDIVSSYIFIYNLLSMSGGWTKIESIETSFRCPCCIEICSKMNFDLCTGKLGQLMDEMCGMDLLEYRISQGEMEYKLKTFLR